MSHYSRPKGEIKRGVSSEEFERIQLLTRECQDKAVELEQKAKQSGEPVSEAPRAGKSIEKE